MNSVVATTPARASNRIRSRYVVAVGLAFALAVSATIGAWQLRGGSASSPQRSTLAAPAPSSPTATQPAQVYYLCPRRPRQTWS